MRLRDLTPAELVDVAVRRSRVREALAATEGTWVPRPAEIDRAPFLDRWELVTYPGTDRQYLDGLCWGHPTLGDTHALTSIVTHRGDGWVITEGSGHLYILGREDREAKRSRILSGRRGHQRPIQASPPDLIAEADDDIPPIQP